MRAAACTLARSSGSAQLRICAGENPRSTCSNEMKQLAAEESLRPPGARSPSPLARRASETRTGDDETRPATVRRTAPALSGVEGPEPRAR